MVYTLLENADSTATPGKKINLAKTSSAFTVEIWTENITALTIDLEGTISGQRWGILQSHPFTATEITNQYAFFTVNNAPFKQIRGHITNIAGIGAKVNMIMEAFGDDE